jgi:phosphoribosylglycinamide formyltransferase-1
MADRIKVAVLASGRGSNFRALAEACSKGDFPAELTILVTDNPDAGAIDFARESGIETAVVDCGKKRGSMTPESSEKIFNIMQKNEIDLICLAGFMRIVKGKLLKEYSRRMINIHPALLPSFKGLHGQKQALEYGVRISGCTVHFVDEGIDTGPIILQKEVPVLQDDTVETLSERILTEEHKAYPLAVKLYAEGRLELSGRKVIIRDE